MRLRSKLTHIKPGVRSALSGRIEIAMGGDRGTQQLFPTPSIARRPLLAGTTALGRTSQFGEALEISKVAQCALQAPGRSMDMTEFVAAEYRDGVRQRFQHVTKALCPEPKAVTARG